MTTIYFVRHAEPNYENHDDLTRELSSKGLEDRKMVTGFLDTRGIDNFNEFCRKQWEDFGYKLPDGENLREVQDRNITALRRILKDHKDKNIVIGSHGTAMSTIINFFDPSFGYRDFEKIKTLMPWVVKFSFEGAECVGIEKFNLFEENDR